MDLAKQFEREIKKLQTEVQKDIQKAIKHSVQETARSTKQKAVRIYSAEKAIAMSRARKQFEASQPKKIPGGYSAEVTIPDKEVPLSAFEVKTTIQKVKSKAKNLGKRVRKYFADVRVSRGGGYKRVKRGFMLKKSTPTITKRGKLRNKHDKVILTRPEGENKKTNVSLSSSPTDVFSSHDKMQELEKHAEKKLMERLEHNLKRFVGVE